MSFDSPAKLHRAERHLQRVRGAGVRTVSVNFGFAIGTSSSAAPSSDGTSVSTIRSASRRRTIADSNNAELTAGRAQCAVKKTTQAAKSRKKFVVEESEAAGDTNVDDSFVFGQKKKARKSAPEQEDVAVVASREVKIEDVLTLPPVMKTTKPSKTTKSKETAVQERSTRARPKRRAAATAAVKVADGFVEEALPVDKKRRAEEQPVQRKRSSKKITVNDREPVVVAPRRTGKDHEITPKRQSKKRKVGSISDEEQLPAKKRKARYPTSQCTDNTTAASPVPSADNVVESQKDHHHRQRTDDECDDTMLAASVAPSRGIEPDGAPSTMEPRLPIVAPLAQRAPPERRTCKDRKTSRATRGRKAGDAFTARRAPVADSSRISDKELSLGKRAPLVETDVNLTMQSNSPQKARRAPADAGRSPSHSLKARDSKPLVPQRARLPSSSTRRSSPCHEQDPRSTVPNRISQPVSDHDQHLTCSTTLGPTKFRVDIHTDSAPTMTRLAGSGARKARGTCVLKDDGRRLKLSSETIISENAALDETGSVAKRGPGTRASRTGRDGVPDIKSKSAARVTGKGESAIPTSSDDVDWILDGAPRKPIQRPKARLAVAHDRTGTPAVRSALSAITPDKPSKLPDIDLDDLITNIAAFAKHDSAAQCRESASFTKPQAKARARRH